MRIRLSITGLFVLASMALAAAAAQAQQIPSPYRYIESKQEAGAFVGIANLGEGRFGFGPSGGVLLGGRWGINLSGPIGFEVQAGSVTGTRNIIDPGRSEGDRAIDEADVLIGLIDARLVFTFTGNRTWNGLAPFLFAGGGMAIDLAGEDAAAEPLLAQDRFDFGNTFLGTLGVGTRFFFSERIVLRTDGMFSLNKLDTPPGFSDPDRGFEAVQESEWVSGLSLTLSAAIRF